MLRRSPLFALIVIMSTIASAEEAPRDAPTGWKLTFADEFDTLNLSRWESRFGEGNRFLGGQGEKEIYVDPTYKGDTQTPLGLNPFSVRNGVLTIRADRPDPLIRGHLEGQLYTSGLLTTRHSFSQRYGYFSMRARFPLGRGLWPAFWLLPSDRSWPPEIDVVEILGDQPTTLYATVHMVGPNHEHIKVGFNPSVDDVTSGFHSYGALWSPAFVAWYFDGKRVAYTAELRDMDKPMYILINLAVGGDWPGQPDATTKFPADMQIDYVRAYALPRD
jgi:serralysin